MSDIHVVRRGGVGVIGDYGDEPSGVVPYGTIEISDHYELEATGSDRAGIEQYYEGAVRATNWRGTDGLSGGGAVVADDTDVEVAPAPKRAPGRPKGSKNKPKVTDSESK